MSSSFIGSKIAIITKSQCRYTGTIIGIDAQASSIILGNVKCFGTENRRGNFTNNSIIGTLVPIMQFANSDIEDLKIVEEEPVIENSSAYSMPVLTSSPAPAPPPPSRPPPPQKQSSIHDDPAIVTAVISSTTNRLVNDLQNLNLSDEKSKTEGGNIESRIRTDSGELGTSWSILSSNQQNPSSGNRSKFFDGFQSNNSEQQQQSQSNRSQQRWPSNTHSTQTTLYQNDESVLPTRQPFFSNDRSYSQQQQHRYQNGHIQRYNYNNNNNRRIQTNNYQRRPGGGHGGNRETFHDNYGNNYNDDFDFETSNRKFNKITSEDEFKQQSESPNQYLPTTDSTTDYEPMYDKKKSFFDNITVEETSDVQPSMYNRTRNQDTFGYDRNQQQQRYRGDGSYRRSYNNYRGNENVHYRQNNNGYQYRY